MPGIGILASYTERAGGPLTGYLAEGDVLLMCRVRDGDGAAYGELWGRYRKPLIFFLHRMVGHHFVAEELAQEVFLRVYRARTSYQPSAKFSTWLYRIATHVAINWMRDGRREKLNDSIEGELGCDPKFELRDETPSIEARMVDGSRVEEIRSAIGRLPQNQKTAVILHKYRGCDYATVARALGCSESAVKSLLFRAYQQLRKTLAHFDSASAQSRAN